jgi:ectoine hydroxylase-related dioxygenase (phytanoyl-CoA dioxygenase family)
VPSEFLSSFGGLWTDRVDAPALARDRLRAGRLAAREFDDVVFWIANGYVIKERAIDDRLIDRVQADIFTAAREGSREVTFWDERGKHQKTATFDDLAKTEAKLLDVHATLASVQRAIFHGDVGRFLEIVFDGPALAFQSLYFEHGSEQGLHQDTAFVYVDEPLAFVASWIALEDVEPGAGELIYYPGSHRLPDAVYAGGTKALRAGDPAMHTYTDDLTARCIQAGLSERRFLPRRGDVLFWAADLAHGGARRSTPATRRSLVTHYCPIGRRPPYAGDGAATPVTVDRGHAVMAPK